MLADLAQWLVQNILDMGYLGIFLLMMIESSFIPFPSEIVLIPAGYLAQQGEMNIIVIFLAALLGSLTGAFINYFGALLIGRRLLMRFGKYIFISNSAMGKMETYFQKHGPISTFTGRLIPGIRQLISIPAGLSKMPLFPFTLYTALGAGIWSTVLILLGYILGEKQELIASYLHQITLAVLGTVVLIIFVYIRRLKINNNEK
ncbi:MAG: DedA family protein [Helicobacteraceae bacterium]|jgi:membrane protein DedA with SNARE-associated domain|nr:DedA family protein [Helicobacteraceae bacterium]